MNHDIAVSVQNISKCYQMYASPSDRLRQFVYPHIKKAIGLKPTTYFQEFWALKDISFELKKGETLGVIGRNGSGKSTLLQILCGTLTPTTGSVRTYGRVAALLELGSGFNPEFTGRENVYLNAAVLGLNRDEIDARLDKILAFADIGRFIDQPVKIYSSGMYVKLAFAVIAHVDADILIVDEALAVGDAVFIQKCMRFIRDFQQQGTLLFVSHDVGSVQNLCKTGLWLANGMQKYMGASVDVANAYLQYTLQEVYGDSIELTTLEAKNNNTMSDTQNPESVDSVIPDVASINIGLDTAALENTALNYHDRLTIKDNLSNAKGWQTGSAEILNVTLVKLQPSLHVSDAIYCGGERVKLTIQAKAYIDLPKPILGFNVKDRLGQELFGENTLPFTSNNLDIEYAGSNSNSNSNRHKYFIESGKTFEAQFDFVLPMLPNGEYVLMASVANGDLHQNIQHHLMHDALVINVLSSQVRWGLVGISFQKAELLIHEQYDA